MKIELIKLLSTEGHFIVELEAQDYSTQLDDTIRTYSNQTILKGFRKGHVPPSLIKKFYGKKILQELILEIAHEAIKNYVQTENLSLIEQPLPIENSLSAIPHPTYSETIQIKFCCGLIPELDLSSVEGLQQEAFIIEEISNETVNSWIEEMQMRHSTILLVPKSEGKMDIIYGTLTGENGFKEQVCLGAHTQLGKGNPSFLGLQIQDVVHLSLDSESQYIIPDAYMKDTDSALYDTTLKLLTSLKGNFQFKVEKINRPVPPELDEHLFHKIFPEEVINSIEAFRGTITKRMRTHMQQLADNLLLHEIKEKALQNLAIPIPEQFIKMKILTSYPTLEGEILNKVQAIYAAEFCWSTIKAAIIKQNQLEINELEILNYPSHSSIKSSDATPQTTKLKVSPNPEKQQETYSELAEEKVMAVLKNKISIKNSQKSIEEFQDILVQKEKVYPNFKIKRSL